MASVAVLLVIFTLVQNSWEQAEETTCSSATLVPAEQTQYALMLSSYEYYTNQDISVKIYFRNCPTSHTPSPDWYKLEAISQFTSVGTFDEPNTRTEAYTSDDKKAIFFKTCEPKVLDLPRVYSWNAPSVDTGIIYFRLTINDPERGCLVIATDIEPGMSSAYYASYSGSSEDYEYDVGQPPEAPLPPEPAQPSENTEATEIEQSRSQNQEESTSSPTDSSHNRERCERKRNCTGANLRDICGSDGITYASRCHKKLQECITGQTIEFDHAGPCTPPPPPTPPLPPCYSLRDSLIEYGQTDWLPVCDCNGYFKPVQCMFQDNGEINCFCSTENGGEVPSSRTTLRCTDPETFEFDCHLLVQS